MSITGFSAALGGAAAVAEVLESSPAYTATASRKIKERAEKRRMTTSKPCNECIAAELLAYQIGSFQIALGML